MLNIFYKNYTLIYVVILRIITIKQNIAFKEKCNSETSGSSAATKSGVKLYFLQFK